MARKALGFCESGHLVNKTCDLISALVGPFQARLSQRLYATLNRLRLSSLAVSYLRG